MTKPKLLPFMARRIRIADSYTDRANRLVAEARGASNEVFAKKITQALILLHKAKRIQEGNRAYLRATANLIEKLKKLIDPKP